jgi:hypothetical protein
MTELNEIEQKILERHLHETALKFATNSEDDSFNEDIYRAFMAGAKLALSGPFQKKFQELVSAMYPAPKESKL